ncbi:hypothetical protein, partial [uncultured Desulfovibrio sp.]|uniref:hypothetical protein n=1 Tax=uncultured Desulfovibrio sp. TaxID=167968 RepID=UPI002671BBEF
TPLLTRSLSLSLPARGRRRRRGKKTSGGHEVHDGIRRKTVFYSGAMATFCLIGCEIFFFIFLWKSR